MNLWEEIVKSIDPGARLLRSAALTGGVSAEVTMLEIVQTDGQKEKLVVRQHGAADRSRNPQIAQDEFRLLRGLHAAGLPVPHPIFCAGTEAPKPYVVTEFVEGQVDMSPVNLIAAVESMADTLTDIHQVDWSRYGLHFLPKQTDWCAALLGKQPAQPDESLQETLIRGILATAWPLPHAHKDVLLHGDYWPGNLLWNEGRLAAVMDWEDAALGDPLFDLANGRLEILWAFGEDAMHRFTGRYQARSPQLDYSLLPCFDLMAALKPAGGLSNWGLEPEIERSMRERHRWFTAQAIGQWNG